MPTLRALPLRPHNLHQEGSKDLAITITSIVQACAARQGVNAPIHQYTDIRSVGIDSITMVEIAMQMEREIGVWIEEAALNQVRTITDLTALVEQQLT